jgi:dolichyl-phosphate beta-glucosyltransferase
MELIPQITIVIPAYNEHRFIGSSVQTIVDYLTGRYERFEVIVVDDGSQDGTFHAVETLHLQMPPDCTLLTLTNEHNSGKGYSIRKGMLSSHGEVAIFMDADLSYDLSAIDSITAAIRSGYDVAIGSRLIEGSEIHTDVPMVRTFTGRMFNLLVQLFLFKGIADTQCGVKGFSHKAARDIFSRQMLQQFSFDIEIIYIAMQLHFHIKQVPVKLINYRKESRVNVITDSWKMLWDIFRVRIHGLRGTYTQSLEGKLK